MEYWYNYTKIKPLNKIQSQEHFHQPQVIAHNPKPRPLSIVNCSPIRAGWCFMLNSRVKRIELDDTAGEARDLRGWSHKRRWFLVYHQHDSPLHEHLRREPPDFVLRPFVVIGVRRPLESSGRGHTLAHTLLNIHLTISDLVGVFLYFGFFPLTNQQVPWSCWRESATRWDVWANLCGRVHTIFYVYRFVYDMPHTSKYISRIKEVIYIVWIYIFHPNIFHCVLYMYYCIWVLITGYVSEINYNIK